MPQEVQIVPKFLHPHVETYINDYTQFTDEVSTPVDTNNKFISVFRSPMGIDNVFVKKDDLTDFKDTYGNSDYSKYGQPLMMPLALLSSGNATVYSMRVMPDDAFAANAILNALYKVNDDGVLEIKYEVVSNTRDIVGITNTSAYATGKAYKKTLKSAAEALTGTKKGDYTVLPLVTFRMMGRGAYGNDYRFRIARNVDYENDYGIKMFSFEALNTINGLAKVGTYVGALTTSSKYNNLTLINDILDDADVGAAVMDVQVIEDNYETLYNLYVETAKAFIENNTDAVAEYEEAVAAYEKYQAYLAAKAIYDADLAAYNALSAEQQAQAVMPVAPEVVSEVEEPEATGILAYVAKNAGADFTTIAEIDEFDPFFGYKVGSTVKDGLVTIVAEATDETTGAITNYSVDRAQGISLTGGDDGMFDTKKVWARGKEGTDVAGLYVEVVAGADGSYTAPTNYELVDTKIRIADAEKEVYKAAFQGKYDRTILSVRRVPCDAMFDANYPFEVKEVLADLANLREASLCYIDSGIETTYANIDNTIEEMAIFNTRNISKEFQHYTTKDLVTKKKCEVTTTYFIAQMLSKHFTENGSHVPFVKAYAELSGHVKNTLEPAIDDIDSDIKEKLYNARINYFETVSENVYQRATQNTAQVINSDLLEENNMNTLFELKKQIERDCWNNLYDFTSAEDRARFAESEKAKFANWEGRKLATLNISFSVTEWEAERSIVHCYVAVQFRNLNKRTIIEIDVNKRDFLA